MKTKNIHKSCLPSTAFGGPCVETDHKGFVVWHDDPKYATMSTEALYDIVDSRCDAQVQNAAAIEIARRAL